MANNDGLANLIVPNANNNGNGIFEQQRNVNNMAAELEQAQGHQRTNPPHKTTRGEEEDDLFPNKRRRSSGGSKKRKSKRRRTHKKRRTNKKRK